jgi:hypothetical protein
MKGTSAILLLDGSGDVCCVVNDLRFGMCSSSFSSFIGEEEEGGVSLFFLSSTIEKKD